MRMERYAGSLLLFLTACVQDVDLGLSDGGTSADTGSADTGMNTDAGDDEITCNQIGVECVAACPMGHTPRPDLTCASGSVCCSTEATTCNGDPPMCTACGRPQPPRCEGTTWVCDPIDCIPCNADSECETQTFCENDFASRTGECVMCPPLPPIACPETGRLHSYGNGCGYVTCDEPPLEWLDVDPSTLSFFALPIGSLRYAASGHVPAARMCVTAIWEIGDLDAARAHCGQSTPYVILTSDTDGPCGHWNYAGNALVESASGCVDFADFVAFGSGGEPHQNLVDLELAVTSTIFSGNIRMKNRLSQSPWPVSFVLEYTTDEPNGSIWIQDRDSTGKQSWVRLYADGVRLPIGGGCDVMECGDPGSCPAAMRSAHNIIRPGAFGGSAALTWDGWIYATPTGATCTERQAAHPRDYEVEFCFGRTVDTSGGEEVVQNLDCRRVSFTYPSPDHRVVLRVDEGG